MQFERIIYAGQAHEQRLADGARAGISIGDGTGTGKTATLAGVILDNWFQARRRAVWFSVKADLIEAVSDEFDRLGIAPPIKLINDFPTEGEIDFGDGVVFCTYRSLIARSKTGKRRIDQLIRWLGSNGVVIFDEGHKAKYAFADDRGKSTQTGAAVLEIQDPINFPDLRVVYSSATSAGEVRHLAYMSRLGLWGEGTNFPLGFEQFAEEIESGGVGALEMVCRDLKAMGRLLGEADEALLQALVGQAAAESIASVVARPGEGRSVRGPTSSGCRPWVHPPCPSRAVRSTPAASWPVR